MMMKFCHSPLPRYLLRNKCILTACFPGGCCFTPEREYDFYIQHLIVEGSLSKILTRSRVKQEYCINIWNSRLRRLVPLLLLPGFALSFLGEAKLSYLKRTFPCCNLCGCFRLLSITIKLQLWWNTFKYIELFSYFFFIFLEMSCSYICLIASLISELLSITLNYLDYFELHSNTFNYSELILVTFNNFHQVSSVTLNYTELLSIA